MQRGLDLRVHAPASVPVHSDRRLLRRALQNFIGNAVRYVQTGGVLLAARQHSDGISLEVWDTGPGIPANHLEQIFEEFHRYDQPGERGQRGLGLGLSICQRISIVLDHPLHVRSEVGRGSVFGIRVPRASAPLRDTAASRAMLEAHDASLHGLRVLCVDNDPEILAGMRALLGRWGVDIACASTVDDALLLAIDRPEVLLVDYHLHDRLDGLDTLDALRGACGDVPGALLTADGSDALKRSARLRGYRVLTKPIKPASLRAFLASVRTQLADRNP